MPKVSICIPAYNQVVYLKRTLDSVLSQTYNDYEVIVTDDTPGLMVKELVEQYDFGGRLHYFKNEQPLGTPQNWNEAIKKAQGDYIKILHHDDWFTTIAGLADFVEAIEKEDVAMVFSNADVVYEKSHKRGSHVPESGKISALAIEPTLLFQENFVGAPSMIMYRRDEQLTFDENLKWLVDVDFYIRFLNKHKRFTHIPKPLIAILAEGSTTVTANCLNNKEVEVYENCYLFNKLEPTFNKEQLITNSHFLLRIFNRFNISALCELKAIGYSGPLPRYFKRIFYLGQLRTFAASEIRKVRSLALSVFKIKHTNR